MIEVGNESYLEVIAEKREKFVFPLAPNHLVNKMSYKFGNQNRNILRILKGLTSGSQPVKQPGQKRSRYSSLRICGIYIFCG